MSLVGIGVIELSSSPASLSSKDHQISSWLHIIPVSLKIPNPQNGVANLYVNTYISEFRETFILIKGSRSRRSWPD